MIQTQRKRIVLFLPHRANPDEGVRVSADLLPLELLQIASGPVADGYEVVLVDAMVHDDYLARVLELCDGALLFASSCILGYQVAHGAEVARAVRARYPRLPMVWGGWFPGVQPEPYLREGIADAVCLGQGEVAFREIVQAIDSGADLAAVPGFAVLKAGEVVYTPHRAVVGFEQFAPVPWELLDFEAYVERQNNPGRAKLRHKLPNPLDMPPGTPLRGFSFFSSYGCPEPCTFCCSPIVTGRRWKAIPGRELADELFALHDRFQFNVLRYQDANFGVAEKRSNEWCEALLEQGAPFWWNATYEIETIARYKEPSVDLLKESRCHLIILGAEAGSEAQQQAIKKKIDLENNLEFALGRIYDRRIQTGTTWIIGYPGESRESMLATIRLAALMKEKFPGSASDIFPFRAIPGSEEWERALAAGYRPPKSFQEWGGCLEYKYEFDDIGLPLDVLQAWKRYGATASFYDGNVHEGAGLVRKALRGISGWRLRKGIYEFPVEQKLFDLYVRLTGQTQKDQISLDRTSGVTPNPVQS
ncbi:MAG TPA: radical SAM protein [Planctomycetota bacterium]|nr:radical SAM protein [Planctomycetota bacterium]